jgi:Na+/proline symporter
MIEDNQNPTLAIPYMIDHIIPIGLKGFVVVGLLSAVMSTADSDLNIASLSIVKDILEPLSNITNQATLLLCARITTIVLGSLSIILALKFHNAVDLVIFAAGFWAPMVLVQFVCALFDVVVKVKSFVLTSLVGTLSFISWEYFAHNTQIKGVFIGTIASLVFFLLSKPIKATKTK